MACLDLKNIKITKWDVTDFRGSDGDPIPGVEYKICRQYINKKDSLEKIVASISCRRNIFTPRLDGLFFSEVYLKESNGGISSCYDPLLFNNHNTLFEAMIYCDLYLKELGLPIPGTLKYDLIKFEEALKL